MADLTQLERALALASLGLHVFPCEPLDAGRRKAKQPLVSGGFRAGTTDAAKITTWWNQWPEALVGVWTGASGVVVLDLDVKKRPLTDGAYELERLEYDFSSPLNYKTPSGGSHWYFRADGVKMRPSVNWQGTPGVDVRAGASYAIFYGEPPASLDGLPPVPDWLRPSSAKVGAGTSDGSPSTEHSGRSATEILEAVIAATASTAYGQAALAKELEILQSTTEGSRNDALYKIGMKLGSLIAGGQLAGQDTVDQVVATAVDIGLETDEAVQTLLRPGGAIDIGMANPRNPSHPIPEFIPSSNDGEVPEGSSAVLAKANILDWHDLWASEEIAEDWLVPGLVCAERAHSIYSDAGVGKSLLMREIAASLAAGKTVLGHPAREPMPVLYLDYENNPHREIKSSLAAMGFTADDLTLLKLASFPEFGSFDTEDGARGLLNVVDQLNPKLIIIDTLSRVIEGDENSSDTWNQFYKFTGKELKKRKIAYVRLDHEGKNASNGARGGSAKRGDVDLVWHYTK